MTIEACSEVEDTNELNMAVAVGMTREVLKALRLEIKPELKKLLLDGLEELVITEE